METILDTIIDSRIQNLLEIININYPDKFKKEQINNELLYIKKHIFWKKRKLKHKLEQIDNKILDISSISITNANTNTTTTTTTNTTTNLSTIKLKNKQQLSNNLHQCSGRTWSKYIYNRITTHKIINSDDIDKQFKVDDYKDLNIKEFNSKYILGSRCKNNTNNTNNNKYCKLHNKHLIHGDYLELPNKELCYHFMKDGKYI